MIEEWSGPYLGEDGIVGIEDRYGRTEVVRSPSEHMLDNFLKAH